MMTISRFGFFIAIVCLFGMGTALVPSVSAQVVPNEVLMTASLPPATLGVPYSISLGGGGGTPPYRWEIINGVLPHGLNLDSEGRLGGEPRSMGSYTFTIRLTDSLSEYVDQAFRLDVGIRTAVSQAPVELTPVMPPVSAPVTSVAPPVLPAPPLPAGISPFPVLPMLGSVVGGMPTLLPYNPGTPVSTPTVPTMPDSAAMPPLQVGTATTATQMDLLQQLARKGIEIHSLVRIPSDPSGVNATVTYYVGRDGRRHAFPHPSVMDSWYRSGMPPTRTLTREELQAIPLGANVTYRPGVKVLQFEGSSMYVVAGGKMIRLVADAQAAANLYGPNWFNQLVGLSDAHFADYRLSYEPAVTGLADFNPSALENSISTPSDTLQI